MISINPVYRRQYSQKTIAEKNTPFSFSARVHMCTNSVVHKDLMTPRPPPPPLHSAPGCVEILMILSNFKPKKSPFWPILLEKLSKIHKIGDFGCKNLQNLKNIQRSIIIP